MRYRQGGSREPPPLSLTSTPDASTTASLDSRRASWSASKSAWAAAAQPQPRPRYVTAEEAGPLLDSSASIAGFSRPARRPIPPKRSAPGSEHVTLTFARGVFRGEEDALVPWLLFGTSFTRAPRLTRAFFEEQSERFNGPANAEARERAFTSGVRTASRRSACHARRRCEQHAADVGTRHDRTGRHEPSGSPGHRPLSHPDVCARHTGKRGSGAALTGRYPGAGAPAERAHVFAPEALQSTPVGRQISRSPRRLPRPQ